MSGGFALVENHVLRLRQGDARCQNAWYEWEPIAQPFMLNIAHVLAVRPVDVRADEMTTDGCTFHHEDHSVGLSRAWTRAVALVLAGPGDRIIFLSDIWIDTRCRGVCSGQSPMWFVADQVAGWLAARAREVST